VWVPGALAGVSDPDDVHRVGGDADQARIFELTVDSYRRRTAIENERTTLQRNWLVNATC